MFSPHIFRANDIRGVWKKDFDLSFTKELAYALCALAKQNKVRDPKFLIGHDARLSGPALYQDLVQNLKKQGVKVAGIGLAPSPLCYFLLHHYKLSACVVITASHNPSNFNGFKIVFHNKYKILSPIVSLKKILSQQRKTQKVYAKKGSSFKLNKERAYLDSLKKEFQLKNCSIIVDTGNGALGPLAKKVFTSLGLKARILFEKPDGSFPNHHPDPTVEKNLIPLKKELQKNSFAFGLAFDGDGDRLVLLRKTGQRLLGDELAFLLLKTLKQNKTSVVLADVKCSDWFFKLAKKQGLKMKMCQSGHGLIRAEMETRKAQIALEFSGHIFFNDRKNRGFDDALYASLRWIEFFYSQDKSLEELLPSISSAKTGEIRLMKSEKEIQIMLNKLKNYLTKRKEPFKKLDGIRLSRKDSWCLFRSSKTQSALSMRFEALNLKKLKALKSEFSKVIACKIP